MLSSTFGGNSSPRCSSLLTLARSEPRRIVSGTHSHDPVAAGSAVADVADLMGDDEQTVREHYARWVPERQARLTKILKSAFHSKGKTPLVLQSHSR